MVLDTLWAIVSWPFEQFWGFVLNLWRWVSEKLSLRDILLPAFYDSLVWLSNQLPLALGGGEPGQMIEASFVLVVTTFFTGIITGGAAWALIGVWVVTGMVGVARFVPVIERFWPIPKFSIGDANSLGVLS